MTEYYKDQLEAGLAYQDFVADQLRKATPCIILGAYTSRKYQREVGESASGVEIKFDRLMRKTGNLYIEVAEKSDPANRDYMPSGIMRDDNTWLYLIGDYQDAYIFSKAQLRSVYADKAHYAVRGIQDRQTPTSIGFTYPIANAMKGMCLKHFAFASTP